MPQSLLGLSFAGKSPLFADAKAVGSSRKLTASAAVERKSSSKLSARIELTSVRQSSLLSPRALLIPETVRAGARESSSFA